MILNYVERKFSFMKYPFERIVIIASFYDVIASLFRMRHELSTFLFSFFTNYTDNRFLAVEQKEK